MELNYLAIILSLLINLLKRYSSKISNLCVAKFFLQGADEMTELKAELIKLRRERDSYSPIDEFAKYALVDRKINKLVDKLKESRSGASAQRMKKIMYFNGAIMTIIVLMSIVLIWTNNSKPIVNFDHLENSQDGSSRRIFFPLDSFLAFPSIHFKNSIGVTAWLFILNRSMDIFINKISFKTTAQ